MLTNLLPEQEKKAVRLENHLRIVKFFAAALSIFFMTASVLILSSFIPLYFEYRGLKESFLIEENASGRLLVEQTLNRAVSVNKTLSLIREHVADSGRASLLLEELLEAGSEVSFSEIAVSLNGDAVLSGTAKNRAAMLNFEKKLRDSGRFREISSPLSNIIREADINFLIRGKLKSF